MKATFSYLASAAVVLAHCQFSFAQPLAPVREGRKLGGPTERTMAHEEAALKEAAIATGKLEPAERAACFAKALDDRNWYDGASAAVALERTEPDSKAARPERIVIFSRDDPTDLSIIATEAKKVRPGLNSSAAELVEAAIDFDSEIRESAIAALLKRPAAAKAAVALLAKHVGSDELDSIRAHALIALGKLIPSTKDALPVVAKALKDNALKFEAFAILTDLGPAASPVLPQLVAMVRACSAGDQAEDRLPSRAECAQLICKWIQTRVLAGTINVERLWDVLGAGDLPSVAPLLTSESTSSRALAIDKFYSLGQASVPTLVDLAKGSDPETRRTALRILSHIGPAPQVAVPALVPSLKDDDWQLRSAAAIALGELGADAAPAVKALVESLKDMDGDVRVCSIEALGRIGPSAAAATAGLIERLHDISPAVRSAAARALGKIGPGAKVALPELKKLSQDKEDYVRQAAEEAAKAIRGKVRQNNKISTAQPPEPSRGGRTLSEWIAQTKVNDELVREKAVIVIGKLGAEAKSAVPVLTALLDDKVWFVRDRAAESLGNIGPNAKSAVPALVKMLGREEVTSRYAAAVALNKIGADSMEAVAALADAATDVDHEVRDAALRALEHVGGEAKAAVPILLKHLGRDEEYYTKRRALKALALLGPPPKEAVADILKLLDDEACRADACAAILKMGSAASEYLPQLVNAERPLPHWDPRYDPHQKAPSRAECVMLIAEWMQSPLPTKRANAERLWKLVGLQDVAAVTVLFNSDSSRDREVAIEKLCEFGDAGVPPFLKLLKSDDPNERRTAIRALGTIGPAARSSIPVLVATLRDNGSPDRSLAAIALGKIGKDSVPAVAALKDVLSEKDSGVRICAIEALGSIGPSAAPATAGLIACLRDESPSIRSAAARALGKIGPGAKTVLPELNKLTHNPEDYVRQAAVEAVKAIASK